MDTLSLLLAGPVVRRVDSKSAAVWGTFRDIGDVSITVSDGRQKSTEKPGKPGGLRNPAAAIVAAGRTHTRPLGQRLHVALAVARVPAVSTANTAEAVSPGEVRA